MEIYLSLELGHSLVRRGVINATRTGSASQTSQHPMFGAAAGWVMGYPTSVVSQPRSRSLRAPSSSNDNRQLIGSIIKTCSGASLPFSRAFHEQEIFTRFFSFAAPVLPPKCGRKQWEPVSGTALSQNKLTWNFPSGTGVKIPPNDAKYQVNAGI